MTVKELTERVHLLETALNKLLEERDLAPPAHCPIALPNGQVHSAWLAYFAKLQ